MLASLDPLAELPAATRVYCGHEYTVANIRFALEVEPDNRELQARAALATAMRKRGEPTLPSTIGLELATNPFMRCDRHQCVRPHLLSAAAPVRSRLDICRDSQLERRISLALYSGIPKKLA